MGKLDTVEVNGPEGDVVDWDAVDGRRVEDDVRRLRQRIFTEGLLEPGASKRRTPGSEGAAAQQCAAATRLLGRRCAASLWSAGAFGASIGGQGIPVPACQEDVRDAGDLADLLRMNRLPEAWIAPPATRELRELVRYRAKLVAIRSGLKAQAHAVLAKAGVLIPVSDLFGVIGRQKLARVPLADGYAQRVISLLELIDVLDAHEARFTSFDRHRTAWR